KTDPPTLLITRFAPLPPVASSTAFAKSPARVRMPRSRPMPFSLSSLSCEPEVPMTLAPSALAVCKAATPTPEEMPVTSSHSPALRRPCAISMSCTTMKTRGMHAASSQERFFGIARASRASMSEYSAKAPLQRPITRSPALNPVTPSPSLATSPAPSPPAAFAGPPAPPFAPGGFPRPAGLDRVPDDQLAAVHPCRVHFQENLPRAGLGLGHVAEFDRGLSGIRLEPKRFHFIASFAAPVRRKICRPVLARSTA